MSNNLTQKNIPKGWVKNRLGNPEVTLVNPEQIDPRRQEDTLFNYIDIGSIGGNKILNTKKFSGKDAPSRARRLVQEDDIIISTVRPNLRAISFVPKRYSGSLVSTGFCVLRGNAEYVNKSFIYQTTLTDDFTDFLIKKTKGSNYPSVTSIDVADYIISLPSIKEQKKIAEILFTIDEEIYKVEEIISQTEKLKNALMQDLFIKGTGHKKFKRTKLGNIPEDWKIVSLGEIGTNIIGLTYSPKDVVSEGGTLVLRSSNIFGNSLKYEDKVFVNKNIPEHLITKNGDILLCTRNGSRNLIGKNAYIDEKSAGHSFGAFMSVYRTEYSKFVFQLFQSKFFKDQINQYLGATINQITTKTLNSFIFPLPPIEEQEKITDILLSVDHKISVGRSLKIKLTHLKKGLLVDLLNGKVRVDTN